MASYIMPVSNNYKQLKPTLIIPHWHCPDYWEKVKVISPYTHCYGKAGIL